ncbi:MAG: IPTL-CTERM sorting domain-containing protein [Thermodesulfobacteriota bacterium]
MKSISIFIITVIVFSLFLLAMPEKGYSQEGCCQQDIMVDETTCIDTSLGGCNFLGGFFFRGQICNEQTGFCEPAVTDVPTLSEWGLVAMAGVLGLVGFMVIRRKKATA